MRIHCWWVYLCDYIYVQDISFCLRSCVYGLVMMWLTGPKWDGDPLTPPLSRPGPPALWNVIHHPLGLSPLMLCPTAIAMLTTTDMNTGAGTDTEMGIAVCTPLTLTGQPATASTAMHYYQQVKTYFCLLHDLKWISWNLDIFELYMHSILNISEHPSHIKTNTSHSGEARIHTYTSCGVIAKWNISHKEKNWQLPKLHFPSPTVHPPHPICGLRHTIETNIWYQICLHCVNMHMCVCVCTDGPQTFICWRGVWAACVFLCFCTIICFDIFGNLLCHLSENTSACWHWTL